ncbi:hypothetical protein BO86DRAFT_454026 [Aspergillus japonicus CBS 114.51]|uniref:Uncharacterized protein n=1 Tax=Aspergillus japonicus CBS 114.51 TaxID=1448312 RepID=A0A8T8XB01_ASPJA|nr:hypothetical protein BO86DRAFT_454026 [Aspergillus japonicus CBS 114.51]RAH85034.1 hypothetical protein BO86DRAFT_454026 [Aspergillus japonicus CBS 114.51]
MAGGRDGPGLCRCSFALPCSMYIVKGPGWVVGTGLGYFSLSWNQEARCYPVPVSPGENSVQEVTNKALSFLASREAYTSGFLVLTLLSLREQFSFLLYALLSPIPLFMVWKGLRVFVLEKLGEWMIGWGLGARIPVSSAQTTTSAQQPFPRQNWNGGRFGRQHDVLDDDLDFDDDDLDFDDDNTPDDDLDGELNDDSDFHHDYNNTDHDNALTMPSKRQRIRQASVGWQGRAWVLNDNDNEDDDDDDDNNNNDNSDNTSQQQPHDINFTTPTPYNIDIVIPTS